MRGLTRAVNFCQSFEFALRAFLSDHHDNQELHSDFTLRELEPTAVGSRVRLNAFIPLSFQSEMRWRTGGCTQQKGGDPMRLLKFGKTLRGEVPVEFATELSAEWLDAQVRRVQEYMHSVLRANKPA